MSNIEPQSIYRFDNQGQKTHSGITSRMTLVDQNGNKLHDVKVSVWSNRGLIGPAIAIISFLFKSKWEKHEIDNKIVLVNKMSKRNSKVLNQSLKGSSLQLIQSIKSNLDKNRNSAVEVDNNQYLIQKTAEGGIQVLETKEEFGRGTFKTTSKVQDCVTQQFYALGRLVIARDASEHKETVQITLDEAKITQKIRKRTGNDPGIINVHQVVNLNGTVGILSEPCEGGEFSVDNLKSKTPKERIRLFLSAAKTMKKVHKAGFVHRDLKPANIMLTANDDPRIIDFGFASTMGTKVTIAGTPIYVPPEISEDMKAGKNDVRATSHHDIWSLGMILLELSSEMDIAEHMNKHGINIHTLNAEIDKLKTKHTKNLTPQELKDALLGMLEEDPKKRMTLDKAISLLEEALKKM